jgi:hypothetical protein
MSSGSRAGGWPHTVTALSTPVAHMTMTSRIRLTQPA